MKGVFFILIITSCSCNLMAQKEKAQVEASIVGFFNGLSLLNTDTLNYYTTEDFHLLEDGLVWNMDTLVSKVMPRKGLNIERINDFKFLRTEQKDDMAWVSYQNTALFKKEDKRQTVRWLESAVLTKKNGRWRIQMLHSTPLK